MLKAHSLSTVSFLTLNKMCKKVVVVFAMFWLGCQGIKMPEACNNPVTFTSDQLVNVVSEGKMSKMIYYMNMDLKLLSYQHAACFQVKEHNTTFAIYLRDVTEYCAERQFMYAVPRKLETVCTNDQKVNWFNKHDEDCKKAVLNSTQEMALYDPNTETLLDYGCMDSYGTVVDSMYWWSAVLRNLDLHDFYKVYKCTRHQRVMDVVVVHQDEKTGEIVEDVLKIKEGEQFMYKLRDLIFRFDDLALTTDPFFHFGNTCYVTKNNGEPLALIDKCNDKSSISQGMFGEIKCDIDRYSNIMVLPKTCKLSPVILKTVYSDYGTKDCKLGIIDADAVVAEHKLPYKPASHTIVMNENGAIVIKRMDSALVVNVKSSVHLVKLEHQLECKIWTQNTYEFMNYRYNKTVKMAVKVESKTPVLISVNCNDQSAIFDPLFYNSTGETQLSFVPINNKILTKCSVLCDGELQSWFQLKGYFQKTDEAVDFTPFKDGPTYRRVDKDSSENIFQVAYEYVETFLSTLWGKIVGAVSTLVLTFLIILAVLICLGKIPCCSFCVTWCRKKPASSDDLNNVRVISNKIMKNKKETVIEMDNLADISERSKLVNRTEFYAYNGELIEIIDEDYSIKPTGIYHKNTLIVHSIPHVIFYDKRFIYKDNKIMLDNRVIVDKVSTSKHVNSKYILEDGIIYDFDEYGKPLMMLRDSNLSNMQILDNDYTEFDNSLYLHGNPIIKNIFLDL